MAWRGVPARRQPGVQTARLHGDGVGEQHVFGWRSQGVTVGQGRVYPLLLQPLEGGVAERVTRTGVHEAAVHQALNGGHRGRLEGLSSAGEGVGGARWDQGHGGGLGRGQVVDLRAEGG